MFDVNEIRKDFPILSTEVYGKPLVYLDNAATAQKPQRVIEATEQIMKCGNANIHRGVHFLSVEATAMYEQARETVRRFINAANTSEIIFTSGATASINLVAYSFGGKFVGEGDNIIVSQIEHHSNIVPWQLLCERNRAELRILPMADDGILMVDELDRLIDGRTRIVAVTQASNVTGTNGKLKKVIAAAHDAGVPVLVDGCQGIVHGGADVSELDCDFYVFSGHKLYGPTGTGVLYGKRELLERMPPFMGGGDMVKTVSFTGTTYADLPLKFEAGTANYTGAAGLAEAILYLEEVGAENIAAWEKELYELVLDGMSTIPGTTIYSIPGSLCPIVSFNIGGIHPMDIGMILDKMGIAVRTGTHCAEPLMTRYGVTGMCRASFAFYNTREEAEAFIKGLERAVRMLG